MFIANKHHLSCEYHGLVIKYIKSHHPNWCIKVGTHPKAVLVGGGGHTNFFCNQTWQGHLVMFSLKLVLKKFYGSFLWMGFNWQGYIATTKTFFTFYHSVPTQGFLVLKGWKAELTLEPPSDFKLGTTGLEIQHLNP